MFVFIFFSLEIPKILNLPFNGVHHYGSFILFRLSGEVFDHAIMSLKLTVVEMVCVSQAKSRTY